MKPSFKIEVAQLLEALKHANNTNEFATTCYNWFFVNPNGWAAIVKKISAANNEPTTAGQISIVKAGLSTFLGELTEQASARLALATEAVPQPESQLPDILFAQYVFKLITLLTHKIPHNASRLKKTITDFLKDDIFPRKKINELLTEIRHWSNTLATTPLLSLEPADTSIAAKLFLDLIYPDKTISDAVRLTIDSNAKACFLPEDLHLDPIKALSATLFHLLPNPADAAYQLHALADALDSDPEEEANDDALALALKTIETANGADKFLEKISLLNQLEGQPLQPIADTRYWQSFIRRLATDPFGDKLRYFEEACTELTAAVTKEYPQPRAFQDAEDYNVKMDAARIALETLASQLLPLLATIIDVKLANPDKTDGEAAAIAFLQKLDFRLRLDLLKALKAQFKQDAVFAPYLSTHPLFQLFHFHLQTLNREISVNNAKRADLTNTILSLWQQDDTASAIQGCFDACLTDPGNLFTASDRQLNLIPKADASSETVETLIPAYPTFWQALSVERLDALDGITDHRGRTLTSALAAYFVANDWIVLTAEVMERLWFEYLKNTISLPASSQLETILINAASAAYEKRLDRESNSVNFAVLTSAIKAATRLEQTLRKSSAPAHQAYLLKQFVYRLCLNTLEVYSLIQSTSFAERLKEKTDVFAGKLANYCPSATEHLLLVSLSRFYAMFFAENRPEIQGDFTLVFQSHLRTAVDAVLAKSLPKQRATFLHHFSHAAAGAKMTSSSTSEQAFYIDFQKTVFSGDPRTYDLILTPLLPEMTLAQLLNGLVQANFPYHPNKHLKLAERLLALCKTSFSTSLDEVTQQLQMVAPQYQASAVLPKHHKVVEYATLLSGIITLLTQQGFDRDESLVAWFENFISSNANLSALLFLPESEAAIIALLTLASLSDAARAACCQRLISDDNQQYQRVFGTAPTRLSEAATLTAIWQLNANESPSIETFLALYAYARKQGFISEIKGRKALQGIHTADAADGDSISDFSFALQEPFILALLQANPDFITRTDEVQSRTLSRPQLLTLLLNQPAKQTLWQHCLSQLVELQTPNFDEGLTFTANQFIDCLIAGTHLFETSGSSSCEQSLTPTNLGLLARLSGVWVTKPNSLDKVFVSLSDFFAQKNKQLRRRVPSAAQTIAFGQLATALKFETLCSTCATYAKQRTLPATAEETARLIEVQLSLFGPSISFQQTALDDHLADLSVETHAKLLFVDMLPPRRPEPNTSLCLDEDTIDKLIITFFEQPSLVENPANLNALSMTITNTLALKIKLFSPRQISQLLAILNRLNPDPNNYDKLLNQIISLWKLDAPVRPDNSGAEAVAPCPPTDPDALLAFVNAFKTTNAISGFFNTYTRYLPADVALYERLFNKTDLADSAKISLLLNYAAELPLSVLQGLLTSCTRLTPENCVPIILNLLKRPAEASKGFESGCAIPEKLATLGMHFLKLLSAGQASQISQPSAVFGGFFGRQKLSQNENVAKLLKDRLKGEPLLSFAFAQTPSLYDAATKPYLFEEYSLTKLLQFFDLHHLEGLAFMQTSSTFEAYLASTKQRGDTDHSITAFLNILLPLTNEIKADAQITRQRLVEATCEIFLKALMTFQAVRFNNEQIFRLRPPTTELQVEQASLFIQCSDKPAWEAFAALVKERLQAQQNNFEYATNTPENSESITYQFTLLAPGSRLLKPKPKTTPAGEASADELSNETIEEVIRTRMLGIASAKPGSETLHYCKQTDFLSLVREINETIAEQAKHQRELDALRQEINTTCCKIAATERTIKQNLSLAKARSVDNITTIESSLEALDIQSHLTRDLGKNPHKEALNDFLSVLTQLFLQLDSLSTKLRELISSNKTQTNTSSAQRGMFSRPRAASPKLFSSDEEESKSDELEQRANEKNGPLTNRKFM